MTIETTKGSVFDAVEDDPGMAEAFRIKTALVDCIRSYVEEHGLTRQQAADRMGAYSTRESSTSRMDTVSALSIDTLVLMTARVGLRPLKVATRPRMSAAADTVHRELPFEDHVFAYLTEEAPESERWLAGTQAGYDKERALYPEDVIGWLRETQPEAWDRLERLNKDNTDKRVLDALVKKLAAQPVGGTLEVLRQGFSVAGGGTLRMSRALPEDDRNETVTAQYAAHRLRVVRQLRYNPRREWSIDLVFFVNGLPVATWELKSDFTQSAESAVRQHKRDRSPKAPGGGVEPLLAFRRGALVHFAVSMTRVMMCTHLRGEESLFLPFDRGNDGAAGNPPEPEGSERYPTAYLWEEIFRRDNLLRLIHRFFLFESTSVEDANGKRRRRETMFFPRYHQWQAVTRLDAAVREEGVGQRYLLEHSAGSGKTNTIAWLCHSLVRMHAPGGERLFSSIIVVTDRTVLDDQLREAIRQIDHQEGVVEGIERAKGFGSDAKSKRLADALLAGAPIVIVTIQTFPFAIEAIVGEKGTVRAQLRRRRRRGAHLADRAGGLEAARGAVDRRGDARRRSRRPRSWPSSRTRAASRPTSPTSPSPRRRSTRR